MNAASPAPDTSARDHWTGRIGFILAAAGAAVGLGNIWKFPFVTGENGGGAFLVIYLACAFTLGLAVILAEFIIGRRAQKDPVGAFRVLGKPAWRIVGIFGVATAFIILAYYNVVAGWTIAWFLKSITGEILIDDAGAVSAMFTAFTTDPITPLLFAAGFMCVTIFIVSRGVSGGIERTATWLMPVLFILLVVMAVRGVTLPGAGAGIEFYLMPDWSQVTGATFLAALGQAFFSLSLGMGTMLAYGSYLHRNINLPGAAVRIVSIDTSVAIIAGLAVIPAVFAFAGDPAGGPGLTFVTLPSVFAQMPLGEVFGPLFFLLLAVAALTSTISLLEPVVSVAVDEYRLSRPAAAALIGLAMFIVGIPCSLSLGMWSDVQIFGMSIFDAASTLTDQVMLPVGGILVALFVGWVMMRDDALDELNADNPARTAGRLDQAWLIFLRLVVPVALAVILVTGLAG